MTNDMTCPKDGYDVPGTDYQYHVLIDSAVLVSSTNCFFYLLV